MKPELILTFAVMAVACYTDIKEGKIKNWTTLPVALLAFILAFYQNGYVGLIWSIKGWGVGSVIFIVTWFLGFSGAGDAKFMGALGALLGPGQIAISTQVWAVVYLVVVLIIKVAEHGYRLDQVITQEVLIYRHKLKVPQKKIIAAPLLSLSVIISLFLA